MRYLIGIVTYNPDLARLKENLDSAVTNDDAVEILLVDNGSDNVGMIEGLLTDYRKLKLMKSGRNNGIAAALNVIGVEAERKECDWFMTLDQDSVLQPYIMQTMSLYVIRPEIGIISPRIEDRHYGRQYAETDQGQEEIEMCITSGNLVRTAVWKECGGFDEQMFIDGVDFDFCLTVREHGRKILRVNDVFLTQETGHGHTADFCGKRVSILNHSPLRLYYIARNYLYLGKKHHRFNFWLLSVLKRMLIVLRYESKKMTKTGFMMKGMRDFLICRMGEYPRSVNFKKI